MSYQNYIPPRIQPQHRRSGSTSTAGGDVNSSHQSSSYSNPYGHQPPQPPRQPPSTNASSNAPMGFRTNDPVIDAFLNSNADGSSTVPNSKRAAPAAQAVVGGGIGRNYRMNLVQDGTARQRASNDAKSVPVIRRGSSSASAPSVVASGERIDRITTSSPVQGEACTGATEKNTSQSFLSRLFSFGTKSSKKAANPHEEDEADAHTSRSSSNPARKEIKTQKRRLRPSRVPLWAKARQQYFTGSFQCSVAATPFWYQVLSLAAVVGFLIWEYILLKNGGDGVGGGNYDQLRASSTSASSPLRSGRQSSGSVSLLAGGSHIFVERDFVALLRGLHFSLGTNYLWPNSYQRELDAITLRERFGLAVLALFLSLFAFIVFSVTQYLRRISATMLTAAQDKHANSVARWLTQKHFEYASYFDAESFGSERGEIANGGNADGGVGPNDGSFGVPAVSASEILASIPTFPQRLNLTGLFEWIPLAYPTDESHKVSAQDVSTGTAADAMKSEIEAIIGGGSANSVGVSPGTSSDPNAFGASPQTSNNPANDVKPTVCTRTGKIINFLFIALIVVESAISLKILLGQWMIATADVRIGSNADYHQRGSSLTSNCGVDKTAAAAFVNQFGSPFGSSVDSPSDDDDYFFQAHLDHIRRTTLWGSAVENISSHFVFQLYIFLYVAMNWWVRSFGISAIATILYRLRSDAPTRRIASFRWFLVTFSVAKTIIHLVAVFVGWFANEMLTLSAASFSPSSSTGTYPLSTRLLLFFHCIFNVEAAEAFLMSDTNRQCDSSSPVSPRNRNISTDMGLSLALLSGIVSIIILAAVNQSVGKEKRAGFRYSTIKRIRLPTLSLFTPKNAQNEAGPSPELFASPSLTRKNKADQTPPTLAAPPPTLAAPPPSAVSSATYTIHYGPPFSRYQCAAMIASSALRCLCMTLVAFVAVLAFVFGVHVIELLLLWLATFLICMWMPAAIDSFSLEAFILAGFAAFQLSRLYYKPWRSSSDVIHAIEAGAMVAIILTTIAMLYSLLHTFTLFVNYERKVRQCAKALKRHLSLVKKRGSKQGESRGEASSASPEGGDAAFDGLVPTPACTNITYGLPTKTYTAQSMLVASLLTLVNRRALFGVLVHGVLLAFKAGGVVLRMILEILSKTPLPNIRFRFSLIPNATANATLADLFRIANASEEEGPVASHEDDRAAAASAPASGGESSLQILKSVESVVEALEKVAVEIEERHAEELKDLKTVASSDGILNLAKDSASSLSFVEQCFLDAMPSDITLNLLKTSAQRLTGNPMRSNESFVTWVVFCTALMVFCTSANQFIIRVASSTIDGASNSQASFFTAKAYAAYLRMRMAEDVRRQERTAGKGRGSDASVPSSDTIDLQTTVDFMTTVAPQVDECNTSSVLDGVAFSNFTSPRLASQFGDGGSNSKNNNLLQSSEEYQNRDPTLYYRPKSTESSSAAKSTSELVLIEYSFLDYCAHRQHVIVTRQLCFRKLAHGVATLCVAIVSVLAMELTYAVGSISTSSLASVFSSSPDSPATFAQNSTATKTSSAAGRAPAVEYDAEYLLRQLASPSPAVLVAFSAIAGIVAVGALFQKIPKLYIAILRAMGRIGINDESGGGNGNAAGGGGMSAALLFDHSDSSNSLSSTPSPSHRKLSSPFDLYGAGQNDFDEERLSNFQQHQLQQNSTQSVFGGM